MTSQSGLLAAGCFSLMMTAGCADMMKPGASSGDGRQRIAVGAQGDSLEACLGRIPSEASAGQKMLAQESCERDEANRKAINAVPGK